MGIDAFTWLYVLAREHVVDMKNDHSGLVRTFTNRASFLVKAGIVPLFVFDGEQAPAKTITRQERERRRTQASDELDGADEPPDPVGCSMELGTLDTRDAHSDDSKCDECAYGTPWLWQSRFFYETILCSSCY